MKKSPLISLTFLVLLLLAGLLVSNRFGGSHSPPYRFNQTRAFRDVEIQLSFGPRTPGSEAHQQTIEYILEQTQMAGWQVELHQTQRMGHPLTNVIAKRLKPGGKQIILGAHYDSRFFSDQDADPALHNLPVPGANDGASGVAVLLELARSLPPDLPVEIWLVFFDAEDQGNIPGWDWILGSRAFVEEISINPTAVVILDMIGDADLNIFLERNSNPQLASQIWESAQKLGFEKYFIPQYKYSILDDHTPFLERGFAAVDVIDFDYPHWHTQQDTLDKVSAESLGIVGETIHNWLSTYE
ncbi:MAG: M28 family peptidase [Chloroflexota bacterium]|nr:MAG: glutamine cyclotransferase [Bellilinea sp.]